MCVSELNAGQHLIEQKLDVVLSLLNSSMYNCSETVTAGELKSVDSSACLSECSTHHGWSMHDDGIDSRAEEHSTLLSMMMECGQWHYWYDVMLSIYSSILLSSERCVILCD